MPVSVDVAIGRASVVELKKAILIYQDDDDGDAFCTVHDVTGVGAGQPVLGPGSLMSTEGLREIHRALYRTQKLTVSPEHVLAATPERVVWFEAARSRVMFFKSQDTFLDGISGQTFPQPPLLFIAGDRSLRVFALAENRRPTDSSPVFTAPYYNTSSRGVCLGSMPLPSVLGVSDTESYADAFFHSAFTHGTSERLLKGWGGSYGEFWVHAQQQGFPVQHLVASEKTVLDVIND